MGLYCYIHNHYTILKLAGLIAQSKFQPDYQLKHKDFNTDILLTSVVCDNAFSEITRHLFLKRGPNTVPQQRSVKGV